MSLRWGIAGASKISHDFCIALKSTLTTTTHEIIAIASQCQEHANKFAKLHNIQKVYNCYDDLTKNDEIEVVYIAVLNTKHFEVAKCMIEHGKHVLCEKPFTMNSTQTQELISLAQKHKVFIMEGLWSRFFPVYRHLQRSIQLNEFGNIKEVYIKHGFKGDTTERIVKKQLGGGIVLDIGCYAIQFVVFVFREMPKSIAAKGKVNSDGVDLYFEVELGFSAERKACIICSGLEELDNQATIITTKGSICIPQYWCPTKYIALGEMYEWPLVNVTDELNYTNSVGLKYEADEVFNSIRSGKLNCSIASHEDTILVATIQDEIRKQIGVQYDSDKAAQVARLIT